jgi:hypothetical protein
MCEPTCHAADREDSEPGVITKSKLAGHGRKR